MARFTKRLSTRRKIRLMVPEWDSRLLCISTCATMASLRRLSCSPTWLIIRPSRTLNLSSSTRVASMAQGTQLIRSLQVCVSSEAEAATRRMSISRISCVQLWWSRIRTHPSVSVSNEISTYATSLRLKWRECVKASSMCLVCTKCRPQLIQMLCSRWTRRVHWIFKRSRVSLLVYTKLTSPRALRFC